MSDREQIEDLLSAYVLTLDVEDVDACVALFVDDGSFEVYARAFAGREKLRGMFTAAPRGMHLAGRCLITVDGDRATARQQLVFVDAATHELRLAIYDDDIARVDGRWRFRSRRCRFVTADGLADRPN